jgi:predicted acetylornithine/succinylornithine family transaminase
MPTNWIEIESKYYMFVVKRQPVVIAKGAGTKVWDVDGKSYLDFTSGWAVNNIGHCHPAVSEAISKQAQTLMQTSNQFYTMPQLQLAEILAENSCLDKIFICNSGAEANEGACKLARKYGKLNRNGANEIITTFNSFHGRTMGMIAATGQPHYQEAWQPLAPGYVNVDYNNIEAIKSATTEKTCAVMLEPLQGEGGVIIPDDDYLRLVREWCNNNNLVLIFDEIQTGLGRLGTLFGYQHFEVEPDVITLAKGLGGGAPIGAFMAKDKFCTLEPGDHGSTFGGNALTCAAAYASTKFIIENDIPTKAQKMGEYFTKGLNKLKESQSVIKDVRGVGLLIAMEFNLDLTPKVVGTCNKLGLLLNPLKPNAIRFMPPLTVSENEIDQALGILEKAISEAA